MTNDAYLLTNVNCMIAPPSLLVPLNSRELASWATYWTSIESCFIGKRVNRCALPVRARSLWHLSLGLCQRFRLEFVGDIGEDGSDSCWRCRRWNLKEGNGIIKLFIESGLAEQVFAIV